MNQTEMIMENKIYEYPDFLVKKNNKKLVLEPKDLSDSSFEQRKLFNSMLNFGYVPFKEGIFRVSDKQIVDFWNFASNSVLSQSDIKEYYQILGLALPYNTQIPTIKETGAFISDSFVMSVAWMNDTSTGKMASAPKAYKRDGLELFNFDEENLGSIYPEYFELYELVDLANSSWKTSTKTERFEFAKKIEKIGSRRKIVLSKSIEQALKYMQD